MSIASKADDKVTFNITYNNGTPTLASGEIALVTPVVSSVSLNVSPELIYDGGYYRYEKDGIMYSAFTKERESSDFKSRLQLSLTYASGVTFSCGLDGYSEYGIQNITVSPETLGKDGDYQTVTANVDFGSGNSKSASIKLPIENVLPVKIEVTAFNGTIIENNVYDDAIESSASLDKSKFDLTFIFNNETSRKLESGEDGSSKDGAFTVENTLLPPEIVFDSDKPYSKDVVFRSTDNPKVSSTVVFSNITYAGPKAITFGNVLKYEQKVLSPLDVTGAYVNVYFTDDPKETGVKMLLSEYPQYCEYKFVYEIREVESTLKDWSADPVIPADAINYNNNNLGVYIRFTYKANDTQIVGTTRNRLSISVSQADFDWLALDTKPAPFDKSGVEKTFTDLIPRLNAAQDDTMKIAVSISDGTNTVSGTYAKIGGYTQGTTNDKVATLDGSGKMTFMHGGTYTVTVDLTSDAFQWINKLSATGNPQRYNSSRLIYTITIQKAPIEVKAEHTGDITYGELENAITDIKNSGVKINLLGSPDTEVTGLDYTFHLKKNPSDETDLETFGKDSIPNIIGGGLGVGEYSLYVETVDSTDYATTKSNTLTLNIVPKEIETTQVIKTATYGRTIYYDSSKNIDDLKNIINVDGNAFVEKYGDKAKADTIISIAPQSGINKIKHADKYDIDVTINNSNYKWETGDAKVANATFTITKNTAQTITPTVTVSGGTSGSSFEYSDTGVTLSYDYTPKPGTADFYLAEDSTQRLKFYKQDGSSWSETTVTESALNTLDAGTYAVVFQFIRGTDSKDGEQDLPGDYDLPNANYNAQFTVTKKPVPVVTISDNTKTYNGASQSFILTDYDSDIMTYRVVSDNTDIDSNTIGKQEPTETDNNFYVTAKHAGTYTVTVNFKTENNISNNYTWATTYADATFTINRKDIAPTWDKTSFDYDPVYDPTTTDETKQKYPHATFEFCAGDTLGYNTVIYSQIGAGNTFDDKDIIKKTELIESGTYYMTVSFTSGPISDYELINYFTEFTIGKKAINKPYYTIENYDWGNVVYNGSAYNILQYIKDVDNKFYADGQLSITYSVNAGETTNDNILTDAKTYTLTVMPNTNYIWVGEGEDKTSYTFKFTIDPKVVEIEWIWTEIEYDGKTHAPTASVKTTGDGALISSDIGQVGVEISIGAEKATNVTNAGKYTATAEKLIAGEKGDRSFNYEIKIGGTYNDTYSYDFVIQKQQVERPNLKVDTIEFGKDNVIEFSNPDIWATLKAKGISVTSRVTGENWLGNNMATDRLAALDADGNFTYTDAGKFSFTITIDDNSFANYRWAEAIPADKRNECFAGTNDTPLTITVNRQTLTIHDWEARTFQRQVTESGEKIYHKPDETYTSTNPEISTELDFLIQNSTTDWTKFHDKGTYYTKYKIADGNKGSDTYSAALNPLNYVFDGSNFANVESNIRSLLEFDYKDGKGAVIYRVVYSADEVSLSVHYAITGQVLNLNYNFTSYRFGDSVDTEGNTQSNFLENHFGITGEVDVLTDLNVEPELNKDPNFTLTLTYYRVDGNTNVKVGTLEYVAGGTPNIIEGNPYDFEGYMPWNAGNYKVTVSWEFNDEVQYQATPRSLEDNIGFTVSALPIEIRLLTFDGKEITDATQKAFTAVYSGETHTFTAEISNAPKRKNGASEATEVDKPAVNVVVKDVSNTTPKNVIDGAYTFTVDFNKNGNGYASRSNYDIHGIEVATLTITKKELLIKPVNKSNVYGDPVSGIVWEWTADAVKGFVNGEESIARQTGYLNAVIKYDGTSVDLNAFTDVKAYTLTFEPNVSIYATFWNNYQFNSGDGEYKVTARPLKVVVDRTNQTLTGTYGDAYALNGEITADNFGTLFTLTQDTSLPNWTNAPAEAKKLFFATAKKSGNEITVSDGKVAEVGEFTLEIESNNPNYIVEFDGTNYYKISRATLKVNVEISIYYGENDPNNFDGNNNTFAANLSDLYTSTQSRNELIYKINDPNFGFKFANDETEFYNSNTDGKFEGSFGYTVNGYTPWETKPGEEKTITFSTATTDDPNAKLIWGNYELVDGGKGKLTVEKQEFTVTLKNTTQEYYSEKSTTEYEISNEQTSSYGGGQAIEHFGGTAYIDRSKVFTITVNDITIDSATQIVTNGVSDLSISADYASDAVKDYYTINFANSATYKITAANMTLITSIPDVNRAYNEQYYTAKQQSELSVNGKNDPMVSGVKYYLSNSSDAPDWKTVQVETTAPSVIHAGDYYIHYLISAANHNDLHVYTHVVITKAENNNLLAGTSFDYNGKMRDSLGDISLPTDAAWTYGDYGNNLSGFFTPQFEFDGKYNNDIWNDGNNQITVTLKFWRNKPNDINTVAADKQFEDTLDNVTGNIKTLLDKWYDIENDKFNYEAGYYSISFEMTENNDYGNGRYIRYFAVKKAILNIRPVNGTTTYGEDFDFGDSYAIETPDWKCNDRKSDVDTLDLTQFTWETNYTKGDNAGVNAYSITVSDSNKYIEIANYTFAFSTDATLTVDKRVLTVTIRNHQNSFDFLNDNIADADIPKDVNDIRVDGNGLLTVTNAAEKNGATEVPLKLSTLALNAVDRGDGKQAKTNNAGTYDIILQWNDNGFENNYTVGGAGFDGINGTYTITSARLTATPAMPESLVYNGSEKVVTVKCSVENTSTEVAYLQDKFTVQYSQSGGGTTPDAPINCGTYNVSVVYSPDNQAQKNNYTISTGGASFTITKAKLFVKITGANIQYGTPFVYNVPWKRGETTVALGKDKVVNDRFSGYTLTFHKGSSDASAISFADLIDEETGRVGEYKKAVFGLGESGKFVFTTDYRSGASATTVGDNKCYVRLDPTCIVTTNYDIDNTANSNNLTVSRRAITVVVSGATGNPGHIHGMPATPTINGWAQAVYDGTVKQNVIDDKLKTLSGLQEVFAVNETDWNGNTGFTLDDLKLALTVNGAFENCGIYDMEPSSTNGNFNIAFEGKQSGGTSASDYKAKFIITKKPITVGVSYRNSNTAKSEVEFGDSIDCAWRFFDKSTDITDNFTYSNSAATDTEYQVGSLGSVILSTDNTFTSGGYTPWTTNAGNYYLGYNVGGLWFKNYSVTCPGVSFEVKPRLIEPTIVGEYTYNNGKVLQGTNYSTPITPDLNFGSIQKTDTSNYSDCLKAISLSYKLGSGSFITTTPSNAGTYSVKLDITGENSGNYRFDTTSNSKSITLDNSFTIKKLAVNIEWGPNSIINVTQANVYTQSYITGYDEHFMKFVSFVHPVIGENGQTVPEPVDKGDGTNGTYKVVTDDGHKFLFTPKAAGRYVLTIRLNDDNYILNGVESTTDEIVFELQIVQSSEAGMITVTLKQQSWEYSQTDDGISTNVSVRYNGDPLYNYAAAYAKVSSDISQTLRTELQDIGYAFNEYDNASHYLTGLGISSFGSYQVYGGNAGTYVMRVSNNNHFGYCVFTVTPKKISLPTFTWTDKPYTGRTQSQSIELNNVKDFVSVTVDATKDNSLLSSATGYLLSAVDRGAYKVTFAPISDNYVFASGTVTEKTWNITKGINTVTFANGSETFTYSGTSGYVINVSAAFGGNITYYYKLASESGDIWTDGKPTNAGSYILKAESTANGDIYDASSDTISLVIKKAELYATPNGTVVYGNAFNKDGRYGYVVTGFVNNQTSANVTPTTDSVEYVLCDASGTEITSSALPTVGTNYTLKLKTDDDLQYGEVVKNLTYDNYYVRLSTGTFTVTPRPVTITVPSKSSVYGDAIDLNWNSVGATVKDAQGNGSFGTLTYSDVLGYIDLRIGDDSNNYYVNGATPDADRYTFSAIVKAGSEADYANFDVSFAYSQYTVTKRRISIAANGIQLPSGNVDTVNETVISQLSNVASKDAMSSIINDLVKTYSGANISGGSTTDFDKVKNVGSYTVTVTVGATYAKNYELTGITAYSFTVIKKQLISDDIVIDSQVYTGSALTPVVSYRGYTATEFNERFNVTYGEWTNVGTYSVSVRIKDPDNYQWTRVSGDTQTAEFEITPAKNIVTSFTVNGWTYGDTPNEPEIATTFDPDGSRDKYTFTYRSLDGKIVNGTPTQAGQYMVFVYITPTTNNYVYDGNDPQNIGFASFTIAKAKINVPTLTVIGEGENKNDVYTGDTLAADVDGFDSTVMDVVYGGVSNLSGGKLYVHAVNAGTYNVTLVLKDTANYEWNSSSALDSDGNVALTWTIAKQKVAFPFDSGKKMIVNGKILEYIPTGFDGSIMTISDNRTGYGGTFTAKVDLIDPDNYEWEDGSVGTVEITWEVLGSNTVFAIVIGTMSGTAGILGAVAAVMYVKFRKKKRLETEAAQKEAEATQQDAEVAQ